MYQFELKRLSSWKIEFDHRLEFVMKWTAYSLWKKLRTSPHTLALPTFECILPPLTARSRNTLTGMPRGVSPEYLQIQAS